MDNRGSGEFNNVRRQIDQLGNNKVLRVSNSCPGPNENLYSYIWN